MRTNIELDEKLVEQGLSLTGLKTKKELVNKALEDLVNFMKRQKLANLLGEIEWEGDLEDMRTSSYEKINPL